MLECAKQCEIEITTRKPELCDHGFQFFGLSELQALRISHGYRNAGRKITIDQAVDGSYYVTVWTA